jgi:hypothetical protein
MPVTSIGSKWSLGNLSFFRKSDGGEIAVLGSTFLLPKIKKIAIAADFGNTEQDSGFTLPAKAVVLGVFVDVTTADSGETLDVGTDGSGSNDPDGYLDGISVAAEGLKFGTLLNSGQTLGALLRVDESGAGVLVPQWDYASGGEKITYTGSSATNTMRGAIYVVYIEVV